MQKIKDLLWGNTAKRFYWTCFGAVIAVCGTTLAGIKVPTEIKSMNDVLIILEVGIATAIVTGLTKEINNRISK